MPRRRFRVTPVAGLIVAIIVVIGFSTYVSNGNFLTAATMSTLTPLVSVAALLALGQGLVIGTGGIDLSIPYTMTLVGTIMLLVSNEDASNIGKAVGISLVACLIIGLVNGLLVEAFGLNALVATLAVGMLVAGVTRLYRGPIDNVTSVPEELQTWARANVAGLSVLLAFTALVVVLLSFYTYKTVRGRRLVASSASPRTAFLMGLWATWYRTIAYSFASVLYGVAAICLAGLLGSPDLSFGNSYQLAPIVAVVIGGAALSGGRISFVNTALGAVFVMLLDYLLRVAGYPSGVSMVVQGLVLAVGLSVIYLVRRRATTQNSGDHAGLPAPQALSAAEQG
jgi:ribose transport system permease protein